MSNVANDRPTRHTEHLDRQRRVPTDPTTITAAGTRPHAPVGALSWG